MSKSKDIPTLDFDFEHNREVLTEMIKKMRPIMEPSLA